MAKKDKDTDANDAAARFMMDVLRMSGSHLLAPMNYLRNLSADLVGWIKKTAAVINRTVRLNAIIRQANLAIRETYNLISRAHVRDLRDVARVTISGARSILTAAAGGADIFRVAMTPARAVEISKGRIIFGRTVTESWTDQAKDLETKFRATVHDGIFRDQRVSVLVDRIEGTAAANFRDGLMSAKFRQAETLIETAATSVANAVLAETFEGMGDVVQTVTSAATLDGRTCRTCSALHGKTWEVKTGKAVGHFMAYPGPSPYHMRCRCTQVIGLKSAKEIGSGRKESLGDKTLGQGLKALVGDKDAGKAEAVIKERMTGKAPDVQTFDEWLSTKSHDQINKILGPGRARLWERGMSVDAMVSPSTLKPLTIVEMEAKFTAERQRSNRDFIGLVTGIRKNK